MSQGVKRAWWLRMWRWCF